MAGFLPTLGDLRATPRLGLATLLAANAFPVVGVVAWGWDLDLLLLLYWGESAVILFFSLVKVAVTSGKAAFGLVPFFILHAGMFMGAHLVFLLAIFVEEPAGGWMTWRDDVLLGVGTLAASHLVSFVVNFVVRKERPGPGMDAMTGFYRRIVVMHLTIIFGAFIGVVIGLRVAALVLLILLKTAADVAGHVQERARAAATVEPVGPTDADAPSSS